MGAGLVVWYHISFVTIHQCSVTPDMTIFPRLCVFIASKWSDSKIILQWCLQSYFVWHDQRWLNPQWV